MRVDMEFLQFDEYGDPFWDFQSTKGESYRLDPENTMVYSHNELNAGYDHLFLELEENEVSVNGLFIVRFGVDKHRGDGAFDRATTEMIENGFQVYYRDTPSDMDKEIIEREWAREIPKISNKKIAKAIEDWQNE